MNFADQNRGADDPDWDPTITVNCTLTPIGTPPIGTRNAPALGHGNGLLGGIDREKARRVAFGLLELSPGLTPGDIEIKDLIDDGRP